MFLREKGLNSSNHIHLSHRR